MGARDAIEIPKIVHTGIAPMKAMALMMIQSRTGPPSLAAAAAQLGVSAEDMDAEFGVIPIDEEDGLYGVQVRADRLPPGTESAEPYRGPFSDPEITLLERGAPSSDS